MGHKDKYKHQRRSRSREKYRPKKTKYSKSDSEDSDDSESRYRKKRQRDRSDSADDSDQNSSRHAESYRKKHRSPSESRERKKKKDKKRKKQRSRSRSRERKKKRQESTDDSSDTDDSRDRGRMSRSSRPSQEEIDRMREEMRRRKEIVKATETPEEKRARRLAKKDAKERKRREKMGWDQEYMNYLRFGVLIHKDLSEGPHKDDKPKGYTNVDNPFGDEHLTDTFVWSKKISKEGKETLDHEEIHQMTKKKMEENRVELEKVKKRRLEREREREEREKEREMLQREKEAEYYREWEKSEDTFHLKQAKMRSEIRIQDGRAKPIDLLAKYISAEDDELAVEMHEPYTYLYGLTISDLEDLLEDIKVYLELEQGKNTEYWKDIVTVTQDELMKLRKMENSVDYRDRREGVNEAVNEEVVSVFKGKTTKQLKLLEEQMKRKLEGGEGVDVGYWESLLQQLKAHMAKTRLMERHQENLRRKLFKLKQEQGIESNPLFPSGIRREGTPSSGRSTPVQRKDSPAPRVTATVSGEVTDGKGSGEANSGIAVKIEEAGPSTSGEQDTKEDSVEESDDEPLIREEDLEPEEEEDPCSIDYRLGSYSPKLFSPADIDDMDAVIYDPADDMKKLELARKQVKSTGRVRLDQEAEFVQKAQEGMDDEEAQFSVQHELEKQSFLWSDKYRPRKPRFFNRVHTGFEWNKYNQTHYDIDNPPPKIVQGYKFNIFYPDLIDKSKTPEYTITPIPENPDFAVLRFHAGPPYEDIAFKIVSKEWEHSYKRSFRCQFANNIMQLWFHFKRERYRR